MEQLQRSESLTRSQWVVVGLFFAAVLCIHLLGLRHWGFHRDEFLYLAQGRRLAWGYWSTPPLIGFVAWIVQNISDSSLTAVRMVPAMAGGITMALVALMARAMGGGLRSVVFGCLPFVLSPGLLRTAGLLQPVVFDILFWTVGAWIVVCYLNNEKDGLLIALGGTVGIGLLNKYSIIFFVIGLLVAVAVTRYRKILVTQAFWAAVAVAVLIATPTIIWQVNHNLPVATHLRELADTQLTNVHRADFLIEQVLIHLPVAAFWMAGLASLFSSGGRRFRLLGITFLAIIGLLLILRGKSYYTLGAYPMLFAAGAVWLERLTYPIVRWTFVVVAIVFGVLVSPFSITYLGVADMQRFGQTFVERTGIDAPLRWETGVVHDLPQDYADMLGWEEIAELTLAAMRETNAATTVVYAENYGQAGAIEHFGRDNLDRVVSFADAYRLWAPDTLTRTLTHLVYVNHDLGADIREAFESAKLVGRVNNTHARERGTGVFVLSNPDSSLWAVYAHAARDAKSTFRRD
jgi:hypothetical protein